MLLHWVKRAFRPIDKYDPIVKATLPIMLEHDGEVIDISGSATLQYDLVNGDIKACVPITVCASEEEAQDKYMGLDLYHGVTLELSDEEKRLITILVRSFMEGISFHKNDYDGQNL